MKASKLFVVGGLLFCVSPVFSQVEDSTRRISEQRERDLASQRRQNQALIRLNTLPQQQKARETLRAKDRISFRLKPSLTKKDREAIAINPEDTKQFLAFLQQDRTGIVRLQSANICDPMNEVIDAASACPDNIVGKATSYSFRTDEYKTGLFADILYQNNKLVSPGALTMGIFSNLGDVDINALGLTSDGVKQLAAFVPAMAVDDVLSQDSQLTRGMRIDKYLYKRQVAVALNNTYVLRTIAYKGKLLGRVNGRNVNLLDSDTRKDMTIVFRVIRKHPDDSVTLVWKQLEVRPPPKILEDKIAVASPQTRN